MARSDIDQILIRVEDLAKEIERFVPDGSKNIQFRADLAGLLVVAIAASYESCVKETLMNFASRHHEKFGLFAQNHFKKLNSRISLSDLSGYASTFDSSVHSRYESLLKARKNRIDKKIGRNITSAYKQILSWRHDFAHAGIRNTTVEEALTTHMLAKRILYIFDEAFDKTPSI